MGYFNKRISSGVFVPHQQGFIEYKGEIGNGSINDITRHLGYNNNETYSPIAKWNKNSNILAVVFELFTRNIIYVLTAKEITYITTKDVNKFLGNDFSVKKEFTKLKINDALSNGIENETLSVDFLTKALKLKNTSHNGMFYAERIETYLYFTNGFLSNYQYDDGFFPWAKHLQEMNGIVYNLIADTANKNWGDNYFQAQKEINLQSEAWSRIPDAYGNEFIKLHLTENGGSNLHMLRVCHYNYPINEEQFKEVNHNRYILLGESNSDTNLYQCGLFQYEFNISDGTLTRLDKLQ